MVITEKQVLNNVIEAKNNAETFIKYAKANKKQAEIDYWQTQLNIFNMLLTKK
jgi:hypothetical protein